MDTPLAVRMSVLVVRAFARMRELILTHGDLARKLADLEQAVGRHDADIRTAFEAIHRLLAPPPEKKRRIGFK